MIQYFRKKPGFWTFSDIDLLIAADQQGIQSMLQHAGFTKAAVQYTRHYDMGMDTELPSFHLVENQDIVQFYRPSYQIVDGKPVLMREASGNYVFCDVELDKQGKIVRTPDGFPVFKQPKIWQN